MKREGKFGMKKVCVIFGLLLLVGMLCAAHAEAGEYTIYYHESFESDAAEQTTTVVYGTPTPTVTIQTLGYQEIGRVFAGWAVYREVDDKWYLKSTSDDSDRAWMTLVEGELPEGYTYVPYWNGSSVSETAVSGAVHFYAQWNEASFVVYYHETENSEASSTTTQVTYGVETATLTIQELGYSADKRVFTGWKVYRDDNQTWRLADENGQEAWMQLENGALPAGYDYALWGSGRRLSRTMPNGQLHFYGTWLEGSFEVFYHETRDSEASSMTTVVTYGVETATLTIQELGYSAENRAFMGWKVYRDDNQTWRLTDENGQEVWMPLEDGALPAGYNYALWGSGRRLSRTIPDGQLHFYGTWLEGTFEIFYHETEESEASSQTTLVNYGEQTATMTIQELEYSTAERVFTGWKVFRPGDQTWRLVDENENEVWMQVENGALPEGYDYALWSEGWMVTKTVLPGEQLHLYATWRAGTDFCVTDDEFGADGTDDEDDSPAIQKALDMAKKTSGKITVRIPAGNYYLGSALTIYSNTDLVLDDQATLIRIDDSRLMLRNASKTGTDIGGYGRSENITISGGTWDGNAASGANNANMIYLFHAEGVTFTGVTMKRCCGNHFIELAGVKDVAITGCTFRDFVRYNGANENSEASISSEAVQLDYASEDSSAGAAPYDGTACQNVTVSGCSFINCLSGVGNHHTANVSNDYTITNNSFNGIDHTCVNLYAVSEAMVSGNEANNINRFACVVANTGTTLITENEISEGENAGTGNANDGSCIDVSTTTDLRVTDNQISGFENCIMTSQTQLTISGNTITDAGEAGLCLLNGSTGNIYENTISACATHGINIRQSDDVNVYENTISTVTKHGILINSCSDILASGNEVSQTGEYGVSVISSNGFALDGNTIDAAGKSGIGVGGSSGNIINNCITNCNEYNIFTYGSCSGNIENNTYDIGYGIQNGGGMTRGANIFLGHDREPVGYFLHYHISNDAEESETVTEIPYETATAIPTAKELQFAVPGYAFSYWRVYRADNKTWRVVDASGTRSWSAEVPEGGDYAHYGDGFTATKLAPIGADVHLYAQWEKAPAAVLTMPEAITRIDDEAFMNDDLITEIRLGGNIRIIGAKAFAHMARLEYVTILGNEVSIAEDAFEGSTPTIKCYENSSAYQFATDHSLPVQIIK